MLSKEEKELLLKDLCARLPYGVKVECKWKTPAPNGTYGMVCTLDSFLLDQIYNVDDVDVPFDEFKPYLFPLSSMTEEQIKEFNSITQKCSTYTGKSILLTDFCNKHHIDWRGFIEKGLALDATGKNVY